MTRARDVASALSGALSSSDTVSQTLSNKTIDGNDNTIVTKRGGTSSRPSTPTTGTLYYNTDEDKLQIYDAGWEDVSQEPAPILTEIDPVTAATTGTTITISGSYIQTGATVKFIGTDATERTAGSVSVVSSAEITATTPSLPVAYEPYDIKVINPDNQFATLDDALDAGGTPTWSTASGTLATINENTSLSTSVSASDPDGTSIVYSSSNLPAWISLNSSTGALTGTAPEIASNTTYNFNITASDGVNTSSRAFAVVVNDTKVLDVLVVAGGGGGGYDRGGGGGAGGLSWQANRIFKTSSFTVTVGSGGSGPTGYVLGGNGTNSVFDTITSDGGGGAGAGSSHNGSNGGSGGAAGGGGVYNTGGTKTQGNTGGATGYGNNAGTAITSPATYNAGGGGAGAAGTNGTTGQCGSGGVGLSGTTISALNQFGAATSSGQLVSGNYYYAGGGGGGRTNDSSPVGVFGAGGYGGGGAGGASAGSNGNAGTVNTGGGGGGGSNNTQGNGGQGGSGIVVIRYSDTIPDIASIGVGLTYTKYVTGGYKYYKFTAGTGSVTM